MKYLIYVMVSVITGHALAQNVKQIPVTPQQKAAAPHKKARKYKKSTASVAELERKRIATKQKNLQRTLKEKNFHIPDSAKHK